ncbi:MAG: hypothetical protein JJ896_09620 [Rhodothermales bacterium]|nr:hypothetical protein [Rhodothermales bacterium]MBO6779897.1 hypothetical protein [Rhodothermales bacterium]
MPKPDSHILELWVRDPERLPADVRAKVARRVARYPEWREAADFWRRYYEELRNVDDEEAADGADDLLK